MPADHGYPVYSAISKSFSSLHGSDWLAIELISGFPSGRGLIALPERDATPRLRHGVKYAGRRLHVEIEKKEDQRTRKGSVLAEPDIPRRRKKSNVFGKSEKAPWETEPANAKAAEVKGSSGGESDSAPDEGGTAAVESRERKMGTHWQGRLHSATRRSAYSLRAQERTLCALCR